MKREFLQNIRVNDQPLTKEIIDAIMAENGKDIENAKASVDVESLRQELAQWQEKFNRAQADHQNELDSLALEGVLQAAVSAARGKNFKAIKALLDMDALRQSEDRESAVTQAIGKLKEEAGYLFDATTPPLYAGVTGTQHFITPQAPADLASALREKFERK